MYNGWKKIKLMEGECSYEKTQYYINGTGIGLGLFQSVPNGGYGTGTCAVRDGSCGSAGSSRVGVSCKTCRGWYVRD